MCKRFFLLIFLAVFGLKLHAQQHIFTAGPTLHLNILEKKVQTSVGLEVAYWNVEGFPYSVDLGFEFQKGKRRIYMEGQTGIGVLGISAGPVLEIDKESGQANLGFQRSIWAGYFVGFNMRWRNNGEGTVKAPGFYAKLPFGRGLYESDDEDSDWSDLFD